MTALSRRSVLRAGLLAAGAAVLSACTPENANLVLPGDPRVAGSEARRRATGQVRTVRLTAQNGTVDLGGPEVTTWTYDGVLPGKEIRVRAGDTIRAELTNRLPAETSVHWHGLALRNDMDGAPDLTQAAIATGSTFTYRFVAENPGTYWFHPHSGTQLDRGLYAPLIVEDPAEPGGYDHDWVIVLDDWIDGTGQTPDDVLATLRQGTGGMMGSMSGTGGSSALLGGDAGDLRYPHYLINGRVPAAPATFTARPGQRARIRIVNAGSDTAFRVALGGHRLRITHTDGYPVEPVETDTLLIAMGERYDVLTTLGDGVFPLVALAEGKDATALALIRTGAGTPPPATIRPAELEGDLAGYDRLAAATGVRLPAKAPDVTHTLDLTGGMMGYDWGINGTPLDMNRRLLVREGQRVRLVFRNGTMMWHPMHLHGHTFQLGAAGPRKDTAIVLPGRTVACDFDAGNPGQWMIHCHNTYHAESGMATVLGYRR
ncbi:FtsP/CotA-like multicopper oxidase with cupredoxin domain [Amycolatopsis lexingtonensis]|uniref:FtsP/CotA-like multicopper oxidase with cupredoxin domain n=1 Tax=Amycolatopsis lexingtonensis TaxID=218822 RepID=A0ABR9HY93_9PSEU|nr:multicopper oxidase family protein [Amycolatopsis lexingtonensis]MBE1495897.1 FtsP/CotA-like multicopper oxidase with cupredoxin domain [Amycolatopsis lexingtonensis]